MKGEEYEGGARGKVAYVCCSLLRLSEGDSGEGREKELWMGEEVELAQRGVGGAEDEGDEEG